MNISKFIYLFIFKKGKPSLWRGGSVGKTLLVLNVQEPELQNLTPSKGQT